MNKKKYVTLTFNVTPETDQKLKKLIEEAEDFGINKTILLNRAIKLFFEEEERKRSEDKGA